MKLAIVVGVSDYQNCSSLSACKNDAEVMKGVFERLGKFDDICVVSDSPKAFEAKQKLTEFINKHKAKEISELVFYYSGHGARYDDDFFYVFSDFKEDRKEVTGLRNTELDGLIRNLNPDLTVKIVDACYSGSSYVKSDSEIKPYLEKSAKENNLNKLYFFHSSSSEETSLASDVYSYFTYSFCKSLSEHEGPIRYRDIMAFVADDMALSGFPKPTFVVQADNTEIFGEVDVNLLDYTKTTLKLVSTTESEEENALENPQTESSLLELVEKKSNEEYCSYEEASANIEQIKLNLQPDFWPPDITTLFDFEEFEIDTTYQIPNSTEIGRWIHKNNKEGLFAKPSYSTQKYFEEEYVEVPRKPNTYRSALASLTALTAFGLDDDKDYKLEKIEKERQVIDGFEFTAEAPIRSLKFHFRPKHAALDNYCLTIVLLFSRRSLVIFHSKESLPYKSWDCISNPCCLDWKVKSIMLKNSEGIVNYIKGLIVSMTSYITEDISQKLEK
ncbi:caspase family protein [Pseudoalteromonas sp. M8]|uniref:caspase family protein n=1 Tax=Pseudoalteromonas sp. M8 TaxID=2692624 RepID=UPI001BA95E55|nr:caspase family protein [Pseudoalteromonas sp. M8]QUI70957.1 hypothetical protein GSF13_14875 [Pseudoalteromonas sp. M8]